MQLRVRVLNCLREQKKGMDEIAELFGVARRTIERWKVLEKAGRLAPITHSNTGPKKLNAEKLEAYMRTHEDSMLSDVAKHFGVHLSSVYRKLHKLGYRYKKTHAVRRKKRSAESVV